MICPKAGYYRGVAPAPFLRGRRPSTIVSTMSEILTEEKLFEEIDTKLSELIDEKILDGLDEQLEKIKAESRALSSSLNRCFKNARASYRYVEIFKLGQKHKLENIEIEEEKLKEYLEEYLQDFFEKNDFMHYREFVRLLRACTIDVGGETSFEIKKRYKDFFFGERLIQAYLLGLES